MGPKQRRSTPYFKWIRVVEVPNRANGVLFSGSGGQVGASVVAEQRAAISPSGPRGLQLTLRIDVMQPPASSTVLRKIALDQLLELTDPAETWLVHIGAV